jgi:hypothetical protein
MEPIQPIWWNHLDSREHSQILHAQVYARDHVGAGAPGHGQFLLIAKLAQLLDQYSMPENKPMQAVPSLLTPAAKVEIDPLRPPDTSKRPKGMA